jgi:hypothetical protein
MVRKPYSKLIESTINLNDFKKIVEVGVWEGANVWWVLEHCKNIDEYWGVDPWEVGYVCGKDGKWGSSFSNKRWGRAYAASVELMVRYSVYRAIKLKSVAAAKLFPNEYFDLVFIDGNHGYTYVKEDIKCWLPLVRNGGVLIGHDYGSKNYPGVKMAVDEICGSTVFIGAFGLWGVVSGGGDFIDVIDYDLWKKMEPKFSRKGGSGKILVDGVEILDRIFGKL